jgi:hypothetical protein
MSHALYRLTDDIRNRIPGVVDPMIQSELFAVADELFNRSNCWTALMPFTTSSTSKEYTLVPDVASRIVRLNEIKDADEMMVRGYMSEPGTVVLWEYPSTTETYTADVVLTVADPTTRDGDPVIPEWALVQYREVLLDGCLGRLMSQIAKPYSNERLAIYHMRRFRNGIAQAKAEKTHGNLYRGQRWSFPRSFAR